MADQKISELSDATLPLTGGELAVVVQGGVTKKVATSAFGGGASKYRRLPTMLYQTQAAGLMVSWGNNQIASFTSGTTSVYGGSTYTKATTAATIGATANMRFYGNIDAYLPPNTGGEEHQAKGWTASTVFPDTDYGTGSTGFRFWFGPSRQGTNLAGYDDGQPGNNNWQGVWLSYSTNRGGNWVVVFYSQSTATPVAVDTGVPFSPGLYNLTIEFFPDEAGMYWKVDNITTGVGGSGTLTSSDVNFPINRTAPAYYCHMGIETLSAVARSFAVENAVQYTLSTE